MMPCCQGRVNNTITLVLRDTGSKTCVVKSSLVKPEQLTGSFELCILIHAVVKRYPMATVDLDTPYYTGMASVVHGHTSPGHNYWQYTRCSRPRHRHKTTRCQMYITVYHRYTTNSQLRQSLKQMKLNRTKNALWYELEQWLLTKRRRLNH